MPYEIKTGTASYRKPEYYCRFCGSHFQSAKATRVQCPLCGTCKDYSPEQIEEVKKDAMST